MQNDEPNPNNAFEESIQTANCNNIPLFDVFQDDYCDYDINEFIIAINYFIEHINEISVSDLISIINNYLYNHISDENISSLCERINSIAFIMESLNFNIDVMNTYIIENLHISNDVVLIASTAESLYGIHMILYKYVIHAQTQEQEQTQVQPS